MSYIKSVQLDGFLSFPPGSPAFELQPLNVVIGPNGAGKSNLIEAFELLAATPTDLADALRVGGGAEQWPWKGEGGTARARLDIVLDGSTPTGRPLRYGVEFGSVCGRAEVFKEVVEETEPLPGEEEVSFYYRFQDGHREIDVREESGCRTKRTLKGQKVPPDQSVLSRHKTAEIYPEVAWISDFFDGIQTFREWTFGRYTPLRQPQRTDLPSHRLTPDNRNLALVLNHVQHEGGAEFNEALGRFLPQFKRMSTYVRGGVIELFLHEAGFASAIPATRLSDGTIRFMAFLATLLNPSPPPLVCIEEPELGIHPDAVLDLGKMLVEASERMQLIVTTHSDALVSALSENVESVVVCERPGAGTELERLDADELSSWLDEYGLGDVWRMGALGGNP